MTKPNDCAFVADPGLTKREYFASLALQGILANRELQIAIAADRSQTNRNCDINAEWANEAVKQADALIIELNKPV